MKLNTIALSALLSVNLFGYSQERIVELPLSVHNGYGPFRAGFGGMSPINLEDENNSWKNTYLKVSKFPEGLTDMKQGHIETNNCQSVYQNYLLGNITKSWYEGFQKSCNWIPDTLNLSKNPIKTKIAFAYGKNSEGILKMVVDANNNLDLSDDNLFTPHEITFDKIDSLAQIYAVDVSFEIFVHNDIVPVSAPLLVMYSKQGNMLVKNFSQYATTQYKGEQIAVSSSGFMDLSYDNIEVAFINDLKDGEKVKREEIYRKNEFIEIKDEIYKISGVNTNSNTLVLEKITLPKTQIFSTQTGYKAHHFQGEEFTTGSTISLEGFKGKYILLDFWAEWCVPCIQEFPALKELYAKTDRTKFEIIGIVGASSPDGLKKRIEQHEITWPQILSNEIVKTYGVNSYPTTFILDTEGVVVAKNLRGKELEEKILSLITEGIKNASH